MSRGVEGREIYLDDADRLFFLKILAETKESHDFRLFAYCLMGNHFHLLIQIGSSPLWPGAHQLLTRYSQHFNHRHLRQGHLFQSRYTAPLCRQDSYLTRLLTYIHLNPVRAGLVNNASEWPWSGHRELMGQTNSRILDLQQLANLRGENIAALRDQYRESLPAEPDHLENSERRRDAEPLPILADSIARAFGIPMEDLCGGRRGKALSTAKLRFIEEARRKGYRFREIAETLQCSPAAITLLKRRRS